ncbi:MAG: PAS domain-containing sensor histidine kinase [Thermoflexales bacterium]|nr:PAS domain-containing sensor histidine kinase [Thermoflexales bacterium]
MSDAKKRHKQLEQALRESEARYQLLLSSVTDYIYTVTIKDGRPLATLHGAGCEAVTGYTPGEYAADPYLWYRMVYWQDRDAVNLHIDQVLAGNTPPPLNHRIVHKDGSLRWVRNVAVPRYDAEGILVAYDGLVSDITEQKRAEEAVAHERDLLFILMDNLPDTIYFKDTSSRFTRVNRAQAETLGLARPEDAIGKTDLDFFSPEHAEAAYADEQKLIETGQPLIGKLERLINAEGDFIRWVSCTKVPVKDKDGKIVGMVGMSRDISDLVEAQDALHQYTTELQARNEELDTFAHTVAHDLKHTLSIIIGLSEVLESEVTRGELSPEEIHSYLSRIAQRGRKMNNIIEELLLLSSVRQVDELQLVPLDMASIVAEAKERLADMIASCQASFSLPDMASWPRALGYAPWIEEVWLNYISNAVKYGGTPDDASYIELGAEQVLLSREEAERRGVGEGAVAPLRLSRDAPPQLLTEHDVEYVRFWVRDNGPGLTPEEQARLFTPFTRLEQAQVKGYGLGLSIVRRIVSKLGGYVGVESQPGQGSQFFFALRKA